jgi:predicted ribosomally synthesized peptide with nif11-like leader
MSLTDRQRFTADFEANVSLKNAFLALGEDPHAWVQLAREKGYGLTVEEAEGLIATYAELSDDELENVAGGWD